MISTLNVGLLIYLCAQQYVGETKREYKYRMAEHMRDTWLKRDKPVATHYNEIGHSFENMLFEIIQIILTGPEDEKSTPRRRSCEKYWIYQLHMLKPLGLNVFG